MTEEQARNHPGVLSGERRARRRALSPGGWGTISLRSKWATDLQYNQSEKGRLAQALHRLSEKRWVSSDRYNQSPKGIKTMIRNKANQRGNR